MQVFYFLPFKKPCAKEGTKSFDTYTDYKAKIEELLKEEDGLIDEPKREQVRLLLKVIKDIKVPK